MQTLLAICRSSAEHRALSAALLQSFVPLCPSPLAWRRSLQAHRPGVPLDAHVQLLYAAALDRLVAPIPVAPLHRALQRLHAEHEAWAAQQRAAAEAEAAARAEAAQQAAQHEAHLQALLLGQLEPDGEAEAAEADATLAAIAAALPGAQPEASVGEGMPPPPALLAGDHAAGPGSRPTAVPAAAAAAMFSGAPPAEGGTVPTPLLAEGMAPGSAHHVPGLSPAAGSSNVLASLAPAVATAAALAAHGSSSQLAALAPAGAAAALPNPAGWAHPPAGEPAAVLARTQAEALLPPEAPSSMPAAAAAATAAPVVAPPDEAATAAGDGAPAGQAAAELDLESLMLDFAEPLPACPTGRQPANPSHAPPAGDPPPPLDATAGQPLQRPPGQLQGVQTEQAEPVSGAEGRPEPQAVGQAGQDPAASAEQEDGAAPAPPAEQTAGGAAAAAPPLISQDVTAGGEHAAGAAALVPSQEGLLAAAAAGHAEAGTRAPAVGAQQAGPQSAALAGNLPAPPVWLPSEGQLERLRQHTPELGAAALLLLFCLHAAHPPLPDPGLASAAQTAAGLVTVAAGAEPARSGAADGTPAAGAANEQPGSGGPAAAEGGQQVGGPAGDDAGTVQTAGDREHVASGGGGGDAQGPALRTEPNPARGLETMGGGGRVKIYLSKEHQQALLGEWLARAACGRLSIAPPAPCNACVRPHCLAPLGLRSLELPLEQSDRPAL